MKTTTTQTLRLTPYAWAKLLYLRDLGPTEVGGFGISPRGDLLLIEDFYLIQQRCTEVTVKFEDQAVADYFDAQVDQGQAPQQFGRIWIHTHPGSSPLPSNTDEVTFTRCFGSADWALMFIVARGGQTYARLRFSAGPGGELELPVEVDFQQPFAAADHPAWSLEYQQRVSEERSFFQRRTSRHRRIALRTEDDLEPEHFLADPFLADPFWDDHQPQPSLLEYLDERLPF